MRVLLISVNKERIPYPVEPLGVAYVAASLLAGGHDVKVLDLCFEANAPEAAATAARGFAADLVGISIRNIDNLTFPKSIFYLPAIKQVIDSLRADGPYPLLLGGSGFSLLPREILAYLDVDYGIAGEAEASILMFVDALDNGREPVGIPMLVTKEGFGEGAAPANRFDFRTLLPARSLLDYKKYSEYGGMPNIQTKRGCPFKCTYCTYPLLEGTEQRLRNPVDVADEVERLHRDYGSTYFFFVDDIFNIPQSHAIGICEEIIRRRVNVSWACFATPKNVSMELFTAMKAAGCNAVEFGTDGGTDTTLRTLGKGFSLSHVERAQVLCSRAGIEAAHYLVMGGPGETHKTLAATFRFMERIRPRAVIAMVGVRIYPGTELEKMSLAEGYISEVESLLEPKFYISGDVRDTVLETVGAYARSRPNWVVPGLDIRSSEEISQALAMMGQKGIMWDMLEKH